MISYKYFIGVQKGINALKPFFRIILIQAVNGLAMDFRLQQSYLLKKWQY